MTMFLVRPQDMDLETAVAIVGDPPEKWHGRCYEIACILADHMKHAQAVYGHYRGPVDPEGYWGRHSSHPFIQHGWVIFKKHNFVMDPTRWSFENVDPYIYFDVPKLDYDEGGNSWRSRTAKPCPDFNITNGTMKFPTATPDSPLARHLDALIPTIRLGKCVVIDMHQAFWLANIHYARLEPFAKDIYQAMADADRKAFVPLDNWERAFRTWE